ncbi:MAG: hypothetical protein ACYTGB_15055, partial [Planctomycetota bacterium]
IGDLLLPVKDHPGPEPELDGVLPAAAVKPPAGTADTDEAAIVGMIRNRIMPASWGPNQGTSIEPRAGKLVIVQRPDVHRKISSLLSDLRARTMGPIEVTARVYSVAEDAVERAEADGKLLSEAAVIARNGQRLHCRRGRTLPGADGGRARFEGVLLDVRPVLSADRKRVFIEGRLGLWRPAKGQGGNEREVRVCRTPPHVRIPLGGKVPVVMGRDEEAEGGKHMVVAVLSAEARQTGPRPRDDFAEPAWMENLRKTLEEEVNLEFTEEPLENCINFLRGLTKANVIVDTKAFQGDGVDPKTPITLRLQKTRLSVALKWVCRMAKLDYALVNGAVFISTPERLTGQLIQRVYDVRALTYQARHFPAPEGGSAPGGVVSGTAVNTLQATIRRVLVPDTWGVNNTSISAAGGKLVVVHKREVHAELRRLLASWHGALRPELRVDVRFYELPAEAEIEDPKAVEDAGKLLSRLGTVGVNGQRLYSLGGSVPTGGSGAGKTEAFRGALVELQPTLSHDRRYVSLDARLSWTGADRNTATLRGNLSLEVGKPKAFSMGVAAGRRVVAVIRAATGK